MGLTIQSGDQDVEEETFIRQGSSLHFSSHLACWLTIEFDEVDEQLVAVDQAASMSRYCMSCGCLSATMTLM